MKISFFTKATLLLISLTTMMSNVVIATSITHFKDIFHNENIELLSRLMLTAPSIVIGVLAPILGTLINNVGKRVSVIFGLFLFALSGSAGLYLDSLYMILLSRGFLGLSIAFLMIVTTSLIGDYFEGEERNRYMGLQNAFVAIGGIIFVAGGGLLSDISWRMPFAVYLIGLLLLPFAYLFLLEIKTINSQIIETKTSPLKNLHIYLLAFLLMLIFYILPTQVPFLIMNHFNASGSLAGAIISSAFVFNALGAIIFSFLKRKFSFSQIYLIGMGIVAIGFSAIGLVSNVYFFFFTSPIMGFGGGILITNVVAWLLSRTTITTRVKSSAYLTSSFFFGQFFSPLATMPLVSIFGVQHFFSVLGGIIGFVLLVIFIYMKLKR